MKSVPHICRNSITKNKSNGIMMLQGSEPEVIENYINDNDGIGLFIRDKCKGKVMKNKVIL
jgi:F-box protein 11